MVNQRVRIPPRETNSIVLLRSRFYCGRSHSPHPLHIITVTQSSDSQHARDPWVERHFEAQYVQPHTHDLFVEIKRRNRPTTTFRVFFKRLRQLPMNPVIGVHGDLVVMRVAAHGQQSVVNMRGSADDRLADYLVQE
ncbi:hypothetical protein BDP27DRAFT_1428286 [Rhodocollybia butyracea]|uniref:Uncharacterized protein n=1 Tax=Rhodocollybia butyracea TaxID=206335 RepID=A0A9P5PG58_9AGAR|nr:hypothetical protein BDP27DRAFT_1428286 [Rhodocollybia butyracea]